MPDDTTVDAEADGDSATIHFVTESSDRVAVLDRLVEGPAGTSEIASDRGIASSDAKTAAEELRDYDLVELLVTDEERIYGLLAKGERALFFIQEDKES